MKKSLIILIVVGVVLGAIGLGFYGYANGINSDGVKMESSLNAQYLDNQNELSSYKTSFYEQIGVANLKSDKMDQIIEDAVKGRYDGKMAPGTGGAMFSAITEAYPNVNLDIYDKIVDFIRASREAYKQKQSKLIDMLRAYDNWRRDGLVRKHFVRMMGFPSDGLEARIGKTVTRGQAALDQMWTIVTTDDTKKAYETGTDAPLTVPGGKNK